MTRKSRVEIEYCVECLFLGRALEIVEDLLQRFPNEIEALSLRPGGEGVFNLSADGRMLLAVDDAGRPPSVAASREAFQAHRRDRVRR